MQQQDPPTGTSPQPRRPGRIVQMGYVVDDLDAALAHWTGVMGVGPFLVTPRIDYASVHYFGAPCDAEITVALASHHGMQIELIHQFAGGASPFRRFLDRRGPGLHHVCQLTDDLDADLAYWAQKGVGVAMGGVTTAGVPFAYLDNDREDHGGMLEIVQPTAGIMRFFDKLERLATGWDGSDPVRRL